MRGPTYEKNEHGKEHQKHALVPLASKIQYSKTIETRLTSTAVLGVSPPPPKSYNPGPSFPNASSEYVDVDSPPWKYGYTRRQ